MRANQLRWSFPVLLLVSALGCGSSRDCVPAGLTQRNWIDLTEPNAYHPAAIGVGERLASALRENCLPRGPDTRAPLNVLAISGGGKFGSFGAGVLRGWTESGTRPEFDVVTGISTGALAATYAFLGPMYDDRLNDLFVSVNDDDIYDRRRPVVGLLTDALADSDPLGRTIERETTPELLRAVAAEHAKGRRLFIGTTNLDTRELVVWDMGALATRGELELFRKVILASASVPGFFPPVEIDVELDGQQYTELHGDGSVTAAVFVRPFMIGMNGTPRSAKWAPRDSKVWVIINSKLYADPDCVRQRSLTITTEAISALLYAQTRNDVSRIATLCLLADADFNLIAIPAEVEVDPNSLKFEREELLRLAGVGRDLARGGAASWETRHPGMLEENRRAPRTGTRFLSGVSGNPCRVYDIDPASRDNPSSTLTTGE